MAAPSRSAGGVARGKWIAAALAIAVHVAFILVLVFTVNWQNPKPEAVTAELYAPPSAAARAEPPAKAEPRPEPPKPQPEPPKPPPEPPKPPPEPVKRPVEAPKKIEPVKPPPKPAGPTKAEIALKDKQELERKDLEKRALEKREAEKAAKEQQQLAEARERQTRESEALKAQADRERTLQQRASTDAAKAKADADYVRRIQAKVRGNVVLPPDIGGNPEAIFEVVQLPTGEILDAQLRKSSGVRAYDEAVQRAILKSSPLPQPDSPELFRRTLTLKFRPLD